MRIFMALYFLVLGQITIHVRLYQTNAKTKNKNKNVLYV